MQDFKMGQFFQSEYISADELGDDEEVIFTVTGGEARKFKGRDGKPDETKLVLFASDQKPLLLNKTRYQAMVSFFGDKTSQWVGKTVKIFAMEQQAYGEMKRQLFLRKGNAAPLVSGIPAPAPVANSNGSGNAMATLVETVVHRTGVGYGPAHVQEALKALGYPFAAPRAQDMPEWEPAVVDYFIQQAQPAAPVPAPRPVPQPALVAAPPVRAPRPPGYDAPKPGQMDNSTIPQRPVAPPADDFDDSDPFADEADAAVPPPAFAPPPARS